MAYRLDLPTELKHVHNVFHISQLRKYVPDPQHIIIAEPVEVTENLMYEERPVQILDYRVSFKLHFNFKGDMRNWSYMGNRGRHEKQVSISISGKDKVSYKLKVSRTKLILRGEGCNSLNLKFFLIISNYLNHKLTTLGVAFQFIILCVYVFMHRRL